MVSRINNNRARQKCVEIVEPPRSSMWGHLDVFRGASKHQNFLLAQRAHGDFLRLRLGRSVMYLVSDPDVIKYVVQDTHSNQIKAGGLQKAKGFLGNGLLVANGEVWRTNRKLAQPAFNSKALERFSEIFDDCAQQWCLRWKSLARSGQVLDLNHEMLELSLTAATRTLFTTSLSSNDFQSFERCLPYMLGVVARRMYALVNLEWVPTPGNLRFRRHGAELDSIVHRIIQERRASEVGPVDLLGMLIASTDDATRAKLDNQQLRDEVMTTLTAGHETTALLLSWTWYLLGKHPNVTERLLDELEGSEKKSGMEVAALPYLQAVLKETLRLYPPAWVIRRQTVTSDTIGGNPMPAGTDFLFSSFVVQRHPGYWQEPDAFKPERFVAGGDPSRPRFAYFPFGGGPRICIGQHFGLLEAAIVVARLLTRFRVELAAGLEISPESSFTLRPDRPVLAALSDRKGSGLSGGKREHAVTGEVSAS